MEIKEVKVYKFNELDEKAKEKAIERYSDINVDYDWWEFDGLMGLSKKELKENKINLKDCPCDIINWKNLYFDLDRVLLIL
jgi:myo-inositol catabolism protein IolC